MLDSSNELPADADRTLADSTEMSEPQWGTNAPRGAKAVLGRVVKEGANVPLFLGQALVSSLRDTGYNTTTSAICEHVDNSIESGANEVRVYFIEDPKQRKAFHVLVLDNGKGMPPNVLKAACAFGGSMRYDNRRGIGRYGMGMKAAALSICPVLDVYTWQEEGAYYNITIDVDAIGQDRSNVVYVPNPELLNMLPPEVTLALNTPMAYPKNPNDSQELFCRDATEIREKLGEHGTIVFMPDCDRLTYRKISTLVDDATREMSRVYRRQLDDGLKLFINNRQVEPFDPMYQMTSARHNSIPELAGRETSSRLLNKWEVQIPVSERDEENKRTAIVRLYFLPIADWSKLPRKVLKNDLKVFDTSGISFMRGDRELDLKAMEGIVGRRSTRDSWWRIEVDFHGDLDEAFGVAMNKQGVRPKAYVQELIRAKIKDGLSEVRRAVDKHWAEQATAESQAHVTAAEQRANEMEALQSTLLPKPSPKDEAEQKQLDENLRGLAVGLKREGETDDQAFERVRASHFITTNTHNEDSPFYRVDFKLGRVILSINTAHVFYEKIYRPLGTVSKKVTETARADGTGDEQMIDATVIEECAQVLTGLQLFLLSLARTQSEMTVNDPTGETQKLFDRLRKQWSMNLETQLTTA